MEEKRVVLSWIPEDGYIAKTSYGEIQVGESHHRPMELLLTALGGCMGVDISTILRKKRQEIEDINIELVGKRREEFPRIFEYIKIILNVKGKNLNKKALEDAVKLSVERYCSVHAMLSKSAKIEVEIRTWEG